MCFVCNFLLPDWIFQKLTYNNSKTLFHFPFWLSDNLLLKFLQKLMSHSILLFLSLTLYIQCWIWFFGLVCWAGNKPWTSPGNIELAGEGLLLINRIGAGHILKVWKMEPKLCCKSIKSDNNAHKVSYIVRVHTLNCRCLHLLGL